MLWEVLVALAGLLAGTVAAVSGFGIGSILTPLLASRMDTRVAIAAVSVPHLIGTAQRFWLTRRHVDRALLIQFGISSAIGGLLGALLHSRLATRQLTLVFGVLLLFTAAAELTGWMRRVAWPASLGTIAGAVSGLLGGLVGNQGSIRTAGLLAYRVEPTAFVATATAVALIVDGARMPVYLIANGRDVLQEWRTLAIASAGVVVGTAIGSRLLPRLRTAVFRRAVAVLLALLGAWMLAQ